MRSAVVVVGRPVPRVRDDADRGAVLAVPEIETDEGLAPEVARDILRGERPDLAEPFHVDAHHRPSICRSFRCNHDVHLRV